MFEELEQAFDGGARVGARGDFEDIGTGSRGGARFRAQTRHAGSRFEIMEGNNDAGFAAARLSQN